MPGPGVREQLQILCNIYALSVLHKHVGDFLVTGCITPKQASLANDQLRSLYSQVSLVILQKFSKLFLEFFLEKYIKYEVMVPCRSVLMLLHLLMHSTTPITTWGLFSVAMMGMCIRTSMRRLGRTHLMTRLCLMDTMNTFSLCLSKRLGYQGCEGAITIN